MLVMLGQKADAGGSGFEYELQRAATDHGRQILTPGFVRLIYESFLNRRLVLMPEAPKLLKAESRIAEYWVGPYVDGATKTLSSISTPIMSCSPAG